MYVDIPPSRAGEEEKRSTLGGLYLNLCAYVSIQLPIYLSIGGQKVCLLVRPSAM